MKHPLKYEWNGFVRKVREEFGLEEGESFDSDEEGKEKESPNRWLANMKPRGKGMLDKMQREPNGVANAGEKP